MGLGLEWGLFAELTVFVVVLLILLFSGMWVAFALGITGVVLMFLFTDGKEGLIALKSWSTLDSFTLTALPLFIFMGEIMQRSKLSEWVYNGLTPLFERIPGKLLQTNIAVCALFSAVSGSSLATAAAVGNVALPELKKRGYNHGLACGTIASGGALGILIPPSLGYIMYGAMVGESVGALFIAGLVPGLMVVIGFMAYVFFICTRYKGLTPASTVKYSAVYILRSLLSTWPIVVLIGIALGSIYAGIATPTEAAALGCVGALVLSLLTKTLSLDLVWKGLTRTSQVSAMLLFLIVCANVNGTVIAGMGLPTQLSDAIVGSGMGRYMILFFIFTMYFLLGMIMDGVAILYTTMPFVYPILVLGLGFNGVWLGIWHTIQAEIGQLTPPFGINLFTVNALTPETPLMYIAKHTVPFVVVFLLVTLIISIWPETVLWLPQAAGFKV